MPNIYAVATRARKQAALVLDGLVVALHVAGGKVGRDYDRYAVAERWDTDAAANTSTALLVLLGLGVLARGDVEVALNQRIDRLGPYLCARQGGVVAAVQRQGTGIQRAIDLGHRTAGTQALGDLGPQVQGEAILLADVEAGANGRPVVGAVVGPVRGVLRAFQNDVVLGRQIGISCLQGAADNVNITSRPRRLPGRIDSQGLPHVERTLLGRLALILTGTLAVGVGDLGTDLYQRAVGRGAALLVEEGVGALG